MRRPGTAFLTGWLAATCIAVAAGVAIDMADNTGGEGGLRGIGALATFFMLVVGIFVLGPMAGIGCAVVAALRRRRTS